MSVELNTANLQGSRILVVDDEFLIAIVIEEMLRDAGCEIVSANTLNSALDGAAHESLSAALLDVRLGTKTTEAVADLLAERSVPFLFYSGQALPQCIRSKHPDAKVLTKPVSQDMLMDALVKVMRH
jgi:CheY-like chemotaxis protein